MPAPIIVRNLKDAHVNQQVPTRNYSSTARLKVSAEAGKIKYSYVYWARPFPLGATITSAYLRFRNAATWAGSVTVSANRILAAWPTSRVNWNNAPAVGGVMASQNKTGAGNGTLWELDITTLMQEIADGTAWFGVRLSANGDAVKNLHSAQSENSDWRPYVVINWSDAPQAPETMIPDGNSAVSKDKPVLSFDFTDVSGDTALDAVQVQIDPTEDWTGGDLWDSGWVTTSTPQLDLSTTSYPGLANAASTFWRVRVRDGAGLVSEWSESAQFRRVNKGTLVLDSMGLALASTNYLPNPSFETNTTGWTPNGTVSLTREAVDPFVGSYSMKIEATAAISTTHLAAYNTPAIAAAEGQVWSGAIYVKPIGATLTGRTARVALAFYNAGGSNVGTTGYGPTVALSPTGYTRISVENVPVPVGFSVTGVRLFVNKMGTDTWAIGDGLRVDAASVVRAATVGDYFDGSTTDIGSEGPYTYAWTGTAHASTSTKSMIYVEDTSPPIFWTFTGATQSAYQVIIEKDGDQIWNTGKISTTDNSIDTPDNLIKDPAAIYTITLRVWDTIDRVHTVGDPIFYAVVKDFFYQHDPTVDVPTGLVVDPQNPWPWVDLTFDRATPPDTFSIYRDGVLVENNLPSEDLFVSGTSYMYRDKLVSPRVSHTWQVVATVNRKDSAKTAGVIAQTDPGFTWVMEPNTNNPVAIVKSAERPAPVVEAVSASFQETHQPIGGGSPVLITQYIRGFEGRVEGVLSDGIVTGLSARDMKNRLKNWKKYPGKKLLLFMVDEMLTIVPYNITYRPRAKGGKVVIYDISFDFFEVE
jgi:hypothetical protein